MFKLYAGLSLILLLGFAFWYVHNESYNSGINAERTNWQTQLVKDAARRAGAENQIIIERPVYRDRIRTIEKSSDTCVIPADILRVLSDAGIYIGPM